MMKTMVINNMYWIKDNQDKAYYENELAKAKVKLREHYSRISGVRTYYLGKVLELLKILEGLHERI